MGINTNIYTSNCNSPNLSNKSYTGPYINVNNYTNTKIQPVYSKITSVQKNITTECMNFDNTTNKLDYSIIAPDFLDTEKIQGITKVKNFIYITAHDPSGDDFSRIYVFDRETNEYIGFIRLEHDSHVGGITYDKENDIIFVTQCDGQINAYNNEQLEILIKQYIENKKTNPKDNENILSMKDHWINIYTSEVDKKEMQSYKDLDMSPEDVNAATTYYYDGILYTATFEVNGPGQLCAYKVIFDKNENTLKYNLLYIDEVPAQTQGIAVTEYDGKKYLLTSQSLIGNASAITTSIITDNNKIETQGKHLYSQYMGMQGLYINNNNEVTCISEFEPYTKELTMRDLTKGYVSNFDYRNLKYEIGKNVTGYIYKNMDDIKKDTSELPDAAWTLYKDNRKNSTETKIKFAECVGETLVDYGDTFVDGAKEIGGAIVDNTPLGKILK